MGVNMKMQVLDNSMFDNGSFECFNFWIATCEGLQQVDATHPIITECRKAIEARMADGRIHYAPLGLGYGGLRILEIQWS
jgi:hypothetical protein